MALMRGHTFGAALFMWFLAGCLTESAISKAADGLKHIETRASARASCSAIGGVLAVDDTRAAECLICAP